MIAGLRHCDAMLSLSGVRAAAADCPIDTAGQLSQGQWRNGAKGCQVTPKYNNNNKIYFTWTGQEAILAKARAYRRSIVGIGKF